MFTASGGINVGVRYTLDLWFVTIYINIQVGATLFLQGPPFQGVCHVNFWVFGFDIAFGPSDAVESPAPIQLLEFYRLTLQMQTATEEDSLKPHIFTCNFGLVSSMNRNRKTPRRLPKCPMILLRILILHPQYGQLLVAITDEKDKEPQPRFNAPLNTKPIFAHLMYLVDDEKRIQSKLKLAITAPPVNKTEFGRTPGQKSVWELRAVISSVAKALWDRYDPSKDPSETLVPYWILRALRQST
ncbi:hypothetical protein Forpi1262_v000003 [Fusarium oxysporum f. sp. raphani]|nr:hypothetical protein Forpi1262_v000003 [Fusarium oxysporum f. sp. raphani]